MSRVTLIYDRDCGFCRWCLGKVLAWDRGHAVRPLPLGTPEANRLLEDVPPAERPRSWHLVDETGSVHSAGSGFVPLLRLLAGGRPFAAAAERFPRATQRSYAFVSGNRGIWGRFVTDGAKRRADQRIASRLRHQDAATSGRPT
jgi:predicted DCC family thiol-disulfide oxidoreductase YuxK